MLIAVRRTLVHLLSAVAVLAAVITPRAAAGQDVETYPSGSVVRVVLLDGTIHVGTVDTMDDSTLVLEGSGGVEISIPVERIRRIESLEGDRFQRRDPNRSRLFFAPTARPVAHGSGYVALYELFFPFVAVGIQNIFTLAGGVSLVPGLESQALYLAPKATLYDGRDFGLAIGGLVGTNTGFDGSAGLVFGIGTYGSSEAAITAGAGFGFVEGEFSTRPVLMLAGEYQVSNVIKLLTENYIVPGYGEAVVAMGGIRFFGSRLAADIGLVTTPVAFEDGGGFPFVPWLGFAYNFGSD